MSATMKCRLRHPETDPGAVNQTRETLARRSQAGISETRHRQESLGISLSCLESSRLILLRVSKMY
jgi:hypothetical protein